MLRNTGEESALMSKNIWINLAGFQLIWWMSVLLGNAALPWVFMMLALHLVFHPERTSEASVMLICALCGIIVDGVLTLLGVFRFAEAGLILPFWLLALWLAFCATLRQGLIWFRGRYLLAALSGGLSAALTYMAAAKLGAVELGFTDGQTFLLLTLIWSGLFPLLLLLSQRLERNYVG